ncbi:MAG TPA: RidA family protein [Polyangia bacterium]|nr:RidA family protein [Polyangia bacterium]
MSEPPEVIRPPGWARPSGSAAGVLAAGRVLAVAGQIGAARDGAIIDGGIAGQLDQALANVGEVVAAAGGTLAHVVSMTIHVTNLAAYRRARPELGDVWRRRMGAHYPAMTLVEVSGLVDEGAVVEVSALAVLP